MPVKFRFKLFSSDTQGESDNVGSMAEYERIMSRSYNDDDITIVQKETKLTEMGQYLVALQWVETGNSSEDAATIKSVIESGV